MCCRVNWEKRGFRFSNVTLCARKCLRHVSALCLEFVLLLKWYSFLLLCKRFWPVCICFAVCPHERTSRHVCCFERNRKSLVLFVVVDFEDSDWLAWLYPSPYTAAHCIYAGWCKRQLFLKTMLCARCYFWKRRGRNIRFSKYPAMCKCGLSQWLKNMLKSCGKINGIGEIKGGVFTL